MDTPEPIATLFDQLKNDQEVAARGKGTIDDSLLIRWGYQNIKNTGLFNRECEKWRKKTTADKKWTNFRKYFILAYNDYLKYDSASPTASDATYTANQVQQILHDELSTILGSTDPNNDPSADDVPPPIDSNTTAPCPASVNAVLTVDDVRRLMQETLATTSSNLSSPCSSSNSSNDPGQRPRRLPLVVQGLLRGKPVSYCWAHG